MNALHKSWHTTEPPTDKLTDAQVDSWIDAFRRRLGLLEGAQPNPNLMLLPPPPVTG